VVTAMSVDMGAYQETVSKIRGGVGTIEGAIPTLQHGAASLATISPFLIPPPIVNWVISAINTFLDWVIDVCKFVVDLIEGILAPFFFYGWARELAGLPRAGRDRRAGDHERTTDCEVRRSAVEGAWSRRVQGEGACAGGCRPGPRRCL